ncbi:MAG: LysR family transcriptional regulator [Polyangiaceae bacterium]
MQLHRLEGFFHVARERGYARAARAFPYPITQPAVHQQVRKLEQELGVSLFERVAKDQVRLTAAGERLFEFCAPFFEQISLVADSIRSARFGGTLRVDTSGLVTRQLLPEFLRALRDARPDIHVDIEDVALTDLTRLANGDCHLIVDYCERVPAGCESRRVATSHSYLVVPAGHRSDLASLRRAAFVSYHPSLPHHAVQMEAVRRHIGVPARTISASGVDAILAFVRAGLGFSVIPWLEPSGPVLDGVVAQRQHGPGTSFPIRAVWRAGLSHPLVEAALAHLPER